LDLSTCGDTQGQVKGRFEEMLQIFLEETDKMGTTEDVLAAASICWPVPGRNTLTVSRLTSIDYRK